MEEFNTVSFGAQRHPTYEKRNKKRRKDEIIDPSFPAGALKTDASDATLGLPSTCHQLKTITRFQPLLFFDFIGPGEAVAVERPWLDVVATFPPPFLRSRFGT
ncbi:hypothetical protein Zmor_008823 [Zophobas morio]|jgi:hypothetical protein|uniref:Uncharacterized protein n=2 Tax=Zophobas morio TaxID=2755281 RepID=A0AA38HIN0_9CUCU|nr:hypothetical protein Zmor_008823 [Zophobas morio]